MKSTIVITDIDTKDTKKSSNTVQKSPKREETNPVQAKVWLNGLQKIHNEPFYLFVDNMEPSFVVFNLCHVGNVMPEPIPPKKPEKKQQICEKEICKTGSCEEYCYCQDKKTSTDSITEDEFYDGRTKGSVIVEGYNWYEKKVGDNIIFINTYGSRSITRDFDGGRHIWRIWLRSDKNLIFTILSDIDIKIGSIEEILDHMKTEADTIIKSSIEISTAFGNVIKSFGTPEFGNTLKDFYKSYLPDVELSKKELNLFHKCFMDEFLNLLSKLIPQEEKSSAIRVLRILFIDPTLQFPNNLMSSISIQDKSPDYSFCPCIDPAEHKRQEKAAVKLQAFFKMIYIKKLKEKHVFTNKKYPHTFEALRSIYMTIFSSKIINTTGPTLLRNFIYNIDMLPHNCEFQYFYDVKNVIVLNQLKGTVSNTDGNLFVPLARYGITCDEDIVVRTYLWSDLEQYVLRIFDNSNNEEICTYGNNAILSIFPKSNSGYTILAYGWDEKNDTRNYKWTLSFVYQKFYPEKKIFIENYDIETIDLQDEYIPSKENKILRYIMKIDGSAILTFRLVLSSEKVQVRFVIKNDEEIIISETKAINSVLVLPSLYIASNINSFDSNTPLESISSIMSSKVKTTRSRSTKLKFAEKNSSLEGMKSNRSGSKRTISKIISTYFIEAYVLDQTWPLTLEEWERVYERKLKNNVEEDIISKQSSER